MPDQWDFYFDTIDGAKASVFLNFWYHSNGAVAGATTRYEVGFHIADAGPHGLGHGPEAGMLQDIEERFLESAAVAGLHVVGRTRRAGRWTLFSYGPPGMSDEVSRITGMLAPQREPTLSSELDPHWTHYFEDLCPSPERERWRLDSSVVESLRSHGDTLETPRRVDHWIYFRAASGRDAFAQSVVRDAGYAVQGETDGTPPLEHGLQIHRVSSVALEDIHSDVMRLIDLAAEHNGEYDGWETFIVTDGDQVGPDGEPRR